MFPVDVSGFELRDGSVPAIRASQRRPEAKATFGEVQPISSAAANAVVLDPADQRLIHTALVNEILKKESDGIICDGSNNRGLESEAALQAARHVVLAATFRYLECAGGGDTIVAGVEAQHHFSQADQIPASSFFGRDF